MRKTMMIIVGLALIGGTGIAVSAATSLDTIERVIPVSASEDIDVSTEFGNEMEEGPLVTVKDAKELVLAQFENSHFKELELEKDNGRYVYEIEIKVDGKDGDVYVDAMNGEIIYIDDDLLKDTSEEHRISNERIGEFISAQDALEIAFAHIGEKGEVDELELERDESRFVYEIEIELSNDREVEMDIDAKTGEIINVEWDD